MARRAASFYQLDDYVRRDINPSIVVFDAVPVLGWSGRMESLEFYLKQAAEMRAKAADDLLETHPVMRDLLKIKEPGIEVLAPIAIETHA